MCKKGYYYKGNRAEIVTKPKDLAQVLQNHVVIVRLVWHLEYRLSQDGDGECG